MPQITLECKYQKNTGLIMSPKELWDIYLYGVSVQSKDGSNLPEDVTRFYIEAAQREIETWLKIKFKTQLVDDNASYYRDDYSNGLPLIKTRYPVNVALSLTGFYKKIEQINYPSSWLSSHTNSDGFFLKRISIVPTSGSQVGTSQDVILTGITTSYYGSLGRYNTLPDYWRYQYVTGFSYKNIPWDIVNVIGKLASIGIFNIAGDLILGAGIASMSLGIDGLSQSISTTSSATNAGYGSRILAYQNEIKASLARIKNIYKGISFTVL